MLEVQECGGFVGAHGTGVIDLGLGKVVGEGESQGVRDPEGFLHQAADPDFPWALVEKLIRCAHREGWVEGVVGVRLCECLVEGGEAGGGSDAESVEGDVPDQLFPMGPGEVGGGGAGDAGAFEEGGQGVCGRGGAGVEGSEDDATMGEVSDGSGGDAVEADEAEAAEDAIRAGEGEECLFVAEAVLEGEDLGARVDERREEVGELVVCGGFETDEDQVDGPDVERGAGAEGMDGERGVRAVDGDAMARDRVEIGAEEEVSGDADAAEVGAVERAEGAAADDGDGGWGMGRGGHKKGHPGFGPECP